VLRGGAGNDLLDGDYYASIVTADYSDAVRGVQVSLSIDGAQNTRGAGIDTLRVIDNLTGSAFDDILTGSAAGYINGYYVDHDDNVLSGLAGNDRLSGLIGNDTLDGGTGMDTMLGGLGDDLYFVDNAADIVTELAAEGQDTVRATVATFTLVAEVETLTFVGTWSFTGTGNALANAITGGGSADILSGGEGNDRLDGLGGADRLIGGAGDDRYVVDSAADRVVEMVEGGYDTVEAGFSYRLTNEVEALVLTGTAAINGVGNALSNIITGTAAANVLYGMGNADTLRGGDGNDRLNGGQGSDFLEGGAGNDLLTGGTERDHFTGGAGADRFTFLAGDAPATRQFADRILDFNHAEGDKIVLRAIDADTGAAGDQNFRFIGTAAFGDVAGELRVATTNAFTYVEGDTNGDGAADFSIRLDGMVALVAGDFVL